MFYFPFRIFFFVPGEIKPNHDERGTVHSVVEPHRGYLKKIRLQNFIGKKARVEINASQFQQTIEVLQTR